MKVRQLLEPHRSLAAMNLRKQHNYNESEIQNCDIFDFDWEISKEGYQYWHAVNNGKESHPIRKSKMRAYGENFLNPYLTGYKFGIVILVALCVASFCLGWSVKSAICKHEIENIKNIDL